MKLEDFNNVSVNIDSDTARAIADQYIQFKYVENFSCIGVIFVFCGLFALGVRWVVKNT